MDLTPLPPWDHTPPTTKAGDTRPTGMLYSKIDEAKFHEFAIQATILPDIEMCTLLLILNPVAKFT